MSVIARTMRSASRTAQSLKALDTMQHAGTARNRYALPRSSFPYGQEVGDGTGSSVVMAPLLWKGRTFPASPIHVEERDRDGTWSDIVDHPMTLLLDAPNVAYDGNLLRAALAMDYDISGNAYLLKVRGGGNRVVELWWAPSPTMEPRWDRDGTTYITHYEYRPDRTKRPIRIENEDVVHIRFLLDPRNTRKGMAPLASVLREVFTDDEAAQFTAAILRNLGVPGVIISPADKDTDVDPAEIKAVYRETFSGEHRGEPMVLGAAANISVLSWSPDQLNLRDLRRIPEERVSGVLGIPAVVAGLGAGLDRAIYNNMKEAKQAAYEDNILPTQRVFAAALRHQLLDDFDVIDNKRIIFDNSTITALQEDENARTSRLRADAAAGMITRAQYLSETGRPFDEQQDNVYVIQAMLMEVPADGDGPKSRTLRRFGDQAKALPDAATKRSARIATGITRRLARERIAHERAFTTVLDRHYQTLGRDVRQRLDERLKATQPDGTKDVLDWPAWLVNMANGTLPVTLLVPPSAASLADAYVAAYAGIGAATVQTVADALDVVIGFDLDDPAIQAITREGGTRAGLVDLSKQTQDALRGALADGRAGGDSIPQLVKRIEQYVEGSHMYPGIAEAKGPDAARKYRAEMISRTESKYAQNISSIEAYDVSSVVDGVLVFDGPECGWSSHDDPDMADGSTRTMDEAREYPIAHPGCLRSLAPLVREP